MPDNVYLGNPNLKKANTPIEFTQENIEEFIRCKEDPVYFAANYVKIVSLDEGLTQFNPYHFQEKADYKLRMKTYQNGCSKVLFHGIKDL